MPLAHDLNRKEAFMGEHEKQPFEAENREPGEFRSADSEADESAACNSAAGAWEGYSLEVLSLWFDP
jgi:hypothetical protein